MKKNYLKIYYPLFITALFFIGCQKEVKQTNQPGEESAQFTGNGSIAKGCRITTFDYYDGVADDHQVDHYVYKDGLVNEWSVWYDLVFKIEYHIDGKLKTAKAFDGDVLVYTVVFVYENGRIVRDIWYDGNTNVIADDYNYTYDKKGQIIKAESSVLGYYVDNVYTPNGDLESWKFYAEGSPVVSGHYTYLKNYKSPFVGGTPGVNYNFPYSNTTFGHTKWWYSSEQIIVYDEFGNPSIYYDEDPAQTQWHVDGNGNLEYVEYTDRLTGTLLSVGFNYENCRKGNGNGNSRITPLSTNKIKKINPRTLLYRNPSKSIKTQIAELRQQLKK